MGVVVGVDVGVYMTRPVALPWVAMVSASRLAVALRTVERAVAASWPTASRGARRGLPWLATASPMARHGGMPRVAMVTATTCN